MACRVQARLLCGIWALLSMKRQMRSVAAWYAQYRHYCCVGFRLCYQGRMVCRVHALLLSGIWAFLLVKTPIALSGLHSTCTTAMWHFGFHINETPIAPARVLHGTGTTAMWELRFLINETRIALSGRMVRTV